jgi:hypothetical protein
MTVFGGALGDLLPLAVGIAISPVPIIACILMLFSPRAKANGPAFLAGWLAGIAVATSVFFVLSGAVDNSEGTGGPSIGDVLFLVLGLGAILLGIRMWRGRPSPGEEAPLPGWMAAIDGFTPARALGLAFLLSAVNPKNLGLAAAAGIVIDRAVDAGGSAVAMIVLFVLVAGLSIAVPVVYLFAGGDAARRTLDGWRTWLGVHNAAVMAVLIVVIGAKLVGNGLDAFL